MVKNPNGIAATELTKRISQKLGKSIPELVIFDAINEVINKISENLIDGEDVFIDNFGIFFSSYSNDGSKYKAIRFFSSEYFKFKIKQRVLILEEMEEEDINE